MTKLNNEQQIKADKLLNKFSKRELNANDLKKAKDRAGNLGIQKDNFLLLIDLAKQTVTGKYKIQPKEIAILAGAIIYVVSPVDAIPDFIPVAGWADDIGILGIAINQLKGVLDKFSQWKENKILVSETKSNSDLVLEQYSDSQNSNDHRYIEDVKFMLEDDGIIDDSERAILNRKIVNYGLTQEQAIILEKSLINSNFSEIEEQYIEDLLFMIEDDGIIDKGERLILNRKREKLGIDSVRSNELEDIVFERLYSYEENEYVKEIKDILENGEISETELKYLNRLAEKTKIMSERKEQIHIRFSI